MNELPIIQKCYDLITWYIPILNRLPRDHKYLLGERIISGLYTFLEELILARYSHERLPRLEQLNGKLDVLRYQSRLLLDFKLISTERFEYVSTAMNDIGKELGGWIRQQRQGKS